MFTLCTAETQHLYSIINNITRNMARASVPIESTCSHRHETFITEIIYQSYQQKKRLMVGFYP